MSKRQKISAFTLKLQRQSLIPHWSIADEKAIAAMALGQSIHFGARTNYLFKLMNLAYCSKLSDILIFVVGLLQVLSMWLRLRKCHSSTPLNTVNHIFAGFGAASEEYFYKRYIEQSTQVIVRINWVTLEGLSQVGYPSLYSMIKIIWQYAFGYTAKIKHAITEMSSNPVVYLTVCAKNIGNFAFFRSFWQLAKNKGVNEATFLAVDIPAFAAADEGINVIYLQHGLMKFNYLFPNLYRIEVSTDIEKQYLSSNFPGITIKKIETCYNTIEKRNVLLILSLDISNACRFKECESLIAFAEKLGMTIVIRPKINIDSCQLSLLAKKLPNAILDNCQNSLEKSFIIWQPKFVAAWSSTGLATALDHGHLPISLYSPNVEEVWDEMVYPMPHRVLFWPRDALLIAKSAQSVNSHKEQLLTLSSYKNYFL